MKSISNKLQKAVRNNIQELDSFFWLLKLYYIEMKNNAAKGLSLGTVKILSQIDRGGLGPALL